MKNYNKSHRAAARTRNAAALAAPRIAPQSNPIGLLPLPSRRIPVGLNSPYAVIERNFITIYELFGVPYQITHHGGAVVGSASLQLLFWGDFWNSATNPSVADIVQAVSTIVDSPYLSELEQYGFQSLSLRDPLVVTQPGPSVPTFSGGQVMSMVWDLIDNDVFPEPDDDGGRIIYMTFAPPGATYEDFAAAGAHNEAWHYDFPTDVDYAWVGWVDHGSLDDITDWFSHELVEIISDPEPYSGWTIDGMPEPINEIADLSALANLRWMVGGFAVQPYYSVRLGSYVVPGDPIPQRRLDITAKPDTVGEEEFLTEGDATVDHETKCFKGTYQWKLFGQGSRWTGRALTDSYIKPSVTWKVQGQDIFHFATSLAVPADLGSDPLEGLISLPAEQGTVSCHLDNTGALVIETALGQPPMELQIECNVNDDALPFDILHLKRTVQRLVSITGRRREMDKRYASDLNKCFESDLRAAKAKLIDQSIIKIDKGDPVPPWVERDLGFLPGDVRQPIREAFFLADLIVRADPRLADQVRGIAQARLAEVRNTQVALG